MLFYLFAFVSTDSLCTPPICTVSAAAINNPLCVTGGAWFCNRTFNPHPPSCVKHDDRFVPFSFLRKCHVETVSGCHGRTAFSEVCPGWRDTQKVIFIFIFIRHPELCCRAETFWVICICLCTTPCAFVPWYLYERLMSTKVPATLHRFGPKLSRR